VWIAGSVATYVIYLISLSKYSVKSALINSAFFYLNPLLIYIDAVWGQIDTLIIMLGLVSIYLLVKKRYLLGYTVFIFGCLTKFQLLALSPIWW